MTKAQRDANDREAGAGRRGEQDQKMMYGGKVKGYEDGGAVPKKYKGFSKLPEAVQMSMDPAAARKYEGGGEVRGMGKAYQGGKRSCKVR